MGPTDEPSKKSSGHLLLFLLGVATWLYLTTFVSLATPIYQGDSSPIFLDEAVRMLHGQIIYRDFFELVLPGTQFVYWGIFKIFGVKAWIPNVTFILLGTGLAWTGVMLARRVLDGWLAYLPSVLFLGFAFVSEPDPTHHWFSAFFVMAALVALIPNRSMQRLTLAGALCAIATLFTQTRGPAAMLGITLFLLWECRQRKQGWRHFVKAQAALWLPFLVTVSLAITYLVEQAGFKQLVFCTVTFPLKYFRMWYWNTPSVYLSEVPNFSWPLEGLAVAMWLSMHVLLPLVFLLFLTRWWKGAKLHPAEPWDRLMLLTMVGLCLFLSQINSLSWLRLCAISLPGFVVLAWLVRSPGKASAISRRLLWAVGVAAMVAQPLIARTEWRAYLTTPTGRVAFLEEDVYEKFRWVKEHTRPGDPFYQASDCNLYFVLKLLNPARLPFLTSSGYTRPDQVQDVIASLERSQARYVLWSVWLDLPYPGRAESFDAARLSPLRDYLKAHYRLVRNFGPPDYEEVWERSP